MTTRYVKTDAGRQAIRDRAQPLTRHARNLLLIIDGQKSGEEWVGLVQGSGQEDLAQLLSLGLIAPAAAAAPAASPRAAAAPAPSLAPMPSTALSPADNASAEAPAAELSAADIVAALSGNALRELIVLQSRQRLDRKKASEMLYEVEHCSNLIDLRKLALNLVEQVRRAQGEPSAQQLCAEMATRLPKA